jgi:hypothetical protein
VSDRDTLEMHLAILAIRAARVEAGHDPQIKNDGLGEWRMGIWVKQVRRWLGGDGSDNGTPQARRKVLDSINRVGGEFVLTSHAAEEIAELMRPRLAGVTVYR